MTGPLAGSDWIGRDPAAVPEFFPPTFDDRPGITRDLVPPDLLRTRFTVPAGVVSARLTVTARGLYRTWLNGVRVGRDELTPGWTDYRVRIPYQQYEVTELVGAGPCWWTAVLADGWWCGYLGMDRGRQARLYGALPAFRARLILRTATGEQSVITGAGWRRSTGALGYADLLMGELIDHRAERTGWHLGADHADGWRPVGVHVDDPAVALVPRLGPPVRVLAQSSAVGVTRVGPTWIVDFGRNGVGRVRLRVRDQPTGTRIHLRHGEVLNPDGSLHTENLRTARAHDIFVCAGPEPAEFEPAFTVHGFRFVEITGLVGVLDPADVTMVVLGSAVTELGGFSCSDPGIDALHTAVVRTIRSNLLEVPTDCPQRDERLGWLADAQLILPTAAFLFDLGAFTDKWLVDIRDGQSPGGAYPDVAPRVVVPTDGAPGWADAGVLAPWAVQAGSPDRARLTAHYASMVRFMDQVERLNPDLLRTRGVNRNYGDWVALDPRTPKDLLATAYWALDAAVMAEIAGLLGRAADRERFTALRADVGAAFVDAFVTADGRVAGGTQTAYAVALGMDLVPAALRGSAGGQLMGAVAERGGAISTGIHGLRFLFPALSDSGRHDACYELLQRTEFPSWQDTLRRGATTIWERWDGITDSGFGPAAMNSFNHCALGTVAEWLHGRLAGLRFSALDGRVHVRPYPGGGLTRAHVWRTWSTGPVDVEWTRGAGAVALRVALPPGVVARVAVPTSDAGGVRVDGPAVATGADGAWACFDAGPGTAVFRAALAPDWAPTPRPATPLDPG